MEGAWYLIRTEHNNYETNKVIYYAQGGKLPLWGLISGASRAPQANFETPRKEPGIVLIHFKGPQFPVNQRPHQYKWRHVCNLLMHACVQQVEIYCVWFNFARALRKLRGVWPTPKSFFSYK